MSNQALDQDIIDYNIKFIGELHRSFMFIERQLKRKLYYINNREGEPDSAESDKVIDDMIRIKEKKKIYKNELYNFLPETVQELMVAPFPFGVHFE